MTMPATYDDIIATVTRIAAVELGVQASDLPTNTDLHFIAGADSVKLVRIIARVEQVYGIELDDEVVFSLKTVTSAADAVAAALRVPE